MNHKPERIVICLIAALLLGSCSNRPKNVLKQKEMVAVLLDMHRLEGVIDATGRMGGSNDDAYYFRSILDKYHITQAEFDSSLVWYTNHPNRFEKVYTRVVARLEAEKDAALLAYQDESVVLVTFAEDNIWTDSVSYEYPKDTVELSELDFSIANPYLLTGDIYKLHFIQRIVSEDSCSNRHFVFRIHYAGHVIDSIVHPLKADSLLRRYDLRMPANEKLRIDSLTGALFAADSCRGVVKHVYTDSIYLLREYNPSIQDSIRNALNLPLDSTLIEAYNQRLKETSEKTSDDNQPLKKRLQPLHIMDAFEPIKERK
ncbi:MAG: DUF4296 domain-containing protein [Prevotellaceae bacterium]|jgi:hypothetical protein|nr:DUF4296 domain-containing protein [Prevotellaceae bacterium]